MHPPEELMVHRFLPAVRQLTALELRRRGMSQSKISLGLGVTQAAVSVYLSSQPQRAYEALAEFSMGKEAADDRVSAVADAVLSGPVAAVQAVESVWRDLLEGGEVCSPHVALYPSLAGCEVCLKRKGGLADATSAVSEAVALLERSPEFGRVMPQVSVNLAMATAESESTSDVVAVPGRIVKVRGRARATLPPEPGASAHISRVLLEVRRTRPEVTSCMNIKYDNRVGVILNKLNLRALVLAHYLVPEGGDPTAAAVSEVVGSHKRGFDVIVDNGGEGIEPNAYLFGRSPVDVARTALRIARLYSPG